jgi:hypothetical protein
MSLDAILSGTPVWVSALLAFLVSRVMKALKGGTAPLSKLAIVPAVFAGWGILHLFRESGANWHAGLIWIAGAVLGVCGGVALARASGMSVDRERETVTLPGSAVPLVVMLVTFASKFWIGFELATTPVDSASMFVLLDAAVSGVAAGIFAGRFLIYWLGFRSTASFGALGDRV